MKVDLPEFKRCCCCLPLRYGLLAWGYIKLMISLAIFVVVTYTVVIYIILMVAFHSTMILPHTMMAIFFDMILLVDIALTIVFLVGGHTKTPRLLRVFYIYSFVFLCISTLLFMISTGFELYYIRHYTRSSREGYVPFGFVVQSKLIIGLTNIGIQVYVTLLTRSEINKLRNNSKFRFSNLATEAKCAMDMETTDPKNGTDDHTNITNEHENGKHDEFEESFQTEVTLCETFNYQKI